MDAQQLKGMAVITLAEAQRIGRVTDVVFDTAPLRAAALRLETDTGERLIAISDVKTVGPDAIMTDDLTTAGQTDAVLGARGLPGLADLAKLKVVGEDGTLLGQITRLEVEADTGDVSSIDVRKTNALGLGGTTTTLTPEQIVSVGAELMTVRRS